MDASLLTTNLEDLTPGENFDLSWTEAKGGITLYLRIVEDPEVNNGGYLLTIWETFEDVKPGLTYSRGWNVPINLRHGSKYQFTIRQKSNLKVFAYPESSTLVLTHTATTRTDPAPSALPTCDDTMAEYSCLPPITSSTHVTGLVTPTSAIPGFTAPAPIGPSRGIPPVEVGTPTSITSGSLTSSSASTPSLTSHLLVPTNSVTPNPSPSSSPSATPISQGTKRNTIIAIGVGTGAGILALFSLAFFLLRYRYRKRHSQKQSPISKREKTPTIPPVISDPKLFPNQKSEDTSTSMDSSGMTRKDAFSIYGSLEENNRTGGGMINGTVKRPSQIMTTSERGFGVRGYGDEVGGRTRELSGYESIYSQDSMMAGVGDRGENSFDGRRETSFGRFI